MNAPMEIIKKKTLYDLLGTRPDATAEELEAAYRSAVDRLQPETDAGRPDALNTLRLLREAYHILSDERQRARYDAWMRPLEGAVDTPPPEAEGDEKFGLAIIITLVLLAMGVMLTVFLLLERAEDVRTEHGALIREQPRTESLPRGEAPQPAPERKP